MYLSIGNFWSWFCFSGLTALHASSEEVAEWLNSKNPANTGATNQYNDDQKRLQQSQEASSSGSNNAGELSNENSAPAEKTKYSFICECFFMTARVLNLGLLKAFSDFKHLVQVITCMFGKIGRCWYYFMGANYYCYLTVHLVWMICS